MPYIEISDEQLKEFDPDGKLKIYEPEDTSKLKEKANQLLGEKKSLQVEFDEYKLDAKKRLAESHNAGGDATQIQSQLDDALGKLKLKEGELESLHGDIRSSKLNGEASRIAATLTNDATRAELLAEKIASRITIDNGEFVVLDANGNQTISSVTELTGQIKERYSFLVDGSQASGGGAKGGSGGATAKPFSEMNATERAKFANDKPTEYAQQLRAN